MNRTRAFGSLTAIALGLAACSGGQEDSSQTADSNATTPEPAAPATTNTAAPAAQPVAFASLTGDAAAGERIFLQCKACHVVEPGVNRVGPSLHGIVGRPAGQVPGYNYSPANKNSGLTWTEEQLFTYLEAPQKAVPGTKMAFAGLKQPQDRADVIAYLKTAS